MATPTKATYSQGPESFMRVISHPHAVVTAAFTDYKAPRRRPDRLRGGNVLVGKKPRAPKSVECPVESSFNDAQFPYIDATIAGLHKLLAGQTLFRRSSTLPSFTDRTVEHFYSRPLGESSFKRALGGAMIDVYSNFGQVYPNLLPALEAMSDTAGLEGTALALHMCDDILARTIDGVKAPEAQVFLCPEATVAQYTSSKQRSVNGEIQPFEVWCQGVGPGRRIIHLAEVAAGIIASDPVVRKGYDPFIERSDILEPTVREQLGAQILAMATADQPPAALT